LIACCLSSLVAAQGRYGNQDDARMIVRDVQRNVHRNVTRRVYRDNDHSYWGAFSHDLSRGLRANGHQWRDERARGLTNVYRYDGRFMHNDFRNEIRRNVREMRNAIRQSVRGAYRWGRHY
jgi:hypothetical protein